MKNNDILRRVRYIFDFGDSKMMNIFSEGGMPVTRAKVSDWLKRDDDPAAVECTDKELAIFLSGLIITKRGAKDSTPPEPEKSLNNNIIFRKLKIALDMKADDIIDVFNLVDFQISKSELSAFFRKVGHRNYKKCRDQILRKFLKGLQVKYRPIVDEPVESSS